MRSLTLSQWRDLRMGVICEDLGASTTARAREFWICWSRLSWYSLEGCDEFRINSGGGNGAGCFKVEIWANTAKFKNVIVAGFRKCRGFVWEDKVVIKNKAKVASRVGCSERAVMYFKKLLFKSNKKTVSFRRVESKKTGSHPVTSVQKKHPLLFSCITLRKSNQFEWKFQAK